MVEGEGLSAGGSEKPSIRAGGFFLLAAAALLIYLRAPLLFHQPRFWAEEGADHFAFAWSHSWGETLFFPRVWFGYYTFALNLSVLLASRLVPLEFAPAVTTAMALFFQLIPVAVIAWSRSNLWSGSGRKPLGVLIVLLTPLSGEIWLNSISSQVHLSLAAFLILMEDPDGAGRDRVWWNRIVLLVAGLSGAVACFLAPAFLLRARWERKREAAVQAALIALAGFLQLGVFVLCQATEPAAPERFTTLPLPLVLLGVLDRTVILPLTGLDAAQRAAVFIDGLGRGGPSLLVAAGLAATAALGCALALLLRPLSRRRKALWTASYVLMTFLSFYGAFGDKAHFRNVEYGHRYFYVSAVMVMIALLWNVRPGRNCFSTLGSAAAAVLLLASLSINAMDYRRTALPAGTMPRWREEVRKWRADPTYEMKTWPPGKKVKLRAP